MSARMVAFVSSESKNEKETAATLVPAQRLSLFGPPPLIAGEDGAAYDELLARIYAAIKPVDIIEEMFIADVMSLEWEVLRWRRLKSSLIQAHGLKALQSFLVESSNRLRSVLGTLCARARQNSSGRISGRPAARRGDPRAKCAQNEAAVPKSSKRCSPTTSWTWTKFCEMRRLKRQKSWCKGTCRANQMPRAVVNEFLTHAGRSIDALMADALIEKLDNIERIDHLTTIAESRRNASLREIDRRRAVLGAALRRNVQEIEDGENEVVDRRQPKEKMRLDE